MEAGFSDMVKYQNGRWVAVIRASKRSSRLYGLGPSFSPGEASRESGAPGLGERERRSVRAPPRRATVLGATDDGCQAAIGRVEVIDCPVSDNGRLVGMGPSPVTSCHLPVIGRRALDRRPSIEFDVPICGFRDLDGNQLGVAIGVSQETDATSIGVRGGGPKGRETEASSSVKSRAIA